MINPLEPRIILNTSMKRSRQAMPPRKPKHSDRNRSATNTKPTALKTTESTVQTVTSSFGVDSLESSLRWSSGCEESSVTSGDDHGSLNFNRRVKHNECGDMEDKRGRALCHIKSALLRQEQELTLVREQVRSVCNQAMVLPSSEHQSSRDTLVFYSTMQRSVTLEQSIDELEILRQRINDDCNIVVINYERAIRRIVSEGEY